ncbi:hypothetical protein FF100_22670 [Methylobacterium terricola]|uniref:Uncharacterized protein n=1 Tax=Methylobacterium terricola TaxID=2583531 RepID=A0A5C4LCV6_9HYPH|nr:hypothetical protein [Methylobacterium terricola]TNC10472.1 hypothetical protein FF100_22670 [Methylobacterium terricola]
MPRFLSLLAMAGMCAALYHIMRLALVGTLAPAIVPLVAGLAGWSLVVVVMTLPWAERRLPGGHRFGWLTSAQLSLVLGILEGVPLWSLPGGHSHLLLGFILLLPTIALTQVTSHAVLSQAERDAWSRPWRGLAPKAPGTPPA